MNRTSWMGMVSALVVSAAGLAGAQGIENTPDTLIYSVEGGFRYDDNRDATETNTESVFTWTFTPGVKVNLDDETTKAYLYYKPTVLWRDNARRDQNDTELYHAAEGRVEHQASQRLTLGAQDRFEMTDDPNVTFGGVTIREDASYWINQSRGWMQYLLSERMMVDFDASFSAKRYRDSEYQDQGDEDRLMVNSGLRYNVDPAIQAFGFVGYDQPSYRGNMRGDYKGYLAGVGMSRAFSDTLTGSASAGYKLLEYTDAEESDAGMPFFQLMGQYQASKNLRLQAQADYSLEPSDRTYYSSKEYTRLLLKGLLALTDSLTADAQVLYANGAYDTSSVIPEGQALAQPLENGDDTLMDYQVGLEFRPPARRYYSRIAYEYEDWTSDVRESFTRNTVSASVGMEF